MSINYRKSGPESCNVGEREPSAHQKTNLSAADNRLVEERIASDCLLDPYLGFLHWWFGYPLAIGAMVGIDGYLVYRFRMAGWL